MAGEFILRSETIRDVLTPMERNLKNDLQRILRLAGFNVEAKAKMLVPVDTGATKNSIFTDMGSIGRLEVRVGPTTDYAPHLEFGTVFQRAQPFMIPAVEKEGPRLAQAAVQVIKRHG